MPTSLLSCSGLVATLLALCSCANFKETRYSTYDLAMSMEQTVPDPPVVLVSAAPHNLPGMIIFATVHGDFPATSISRQAWLLKREVERLGLRPDCMKFETRGSNYAGSTSQYIGYGLAMSTPVYRPQAVIHCYRLRPASLGLKWNDSFMLTWVSENTRDESGIQEGDTLLSINGQTIERSSQGTSPSENEALNLRAGDEVSLVWIRPGDGRMDGRAQAVAPLPFPSGITSIATKPEPRNHTDDEY